MPYQENSNNNQDVTPEEYFHLLAIQRRVLQSQGGATSRMSQGDTSFPQHPSMMQQMQMMPPQQMMQALQDMGHYSRGNQMYGNNTLHHSMSFNDYGNRRGHQSNLSRSTGNYQFNQGVDMSSNMAHVNSYTRSSLSRSLDPKLVDNVGFVGEMMASSFPNRMTDAGSRILYTAPTRSNNLSYGKSMITQRLTNSSPPAKLPTNDTLSAQNDCNTVDLTDELGQASAGVLSPIAQGKRRRLNSDELVREMLGDYTPAAANSDRQEKTVQYTYTEHAADMNVEDARACLSPCTRRIEGIHSHLTPMDPNHARGFADTDSPIGQTPIMFAKFFLDAEDNDEQGNANIKAGIPLPPLYQSEKSSPQGGRVRTFEFKDVQFDPNFSVTDQDPVLMTPFSSEPLCLPPRRKKRVTPKPKKKVVTKSSGSSNSSSNENSPTKSHRKQKTKVPESPTHGHIITPYSAAIVALSSEIRNQMLSTDSANDDDHSSPASTGNPTLDGSSRSEDGLSIPQFASSMEASQFSQQSIHDWDKKFGLRRAHSKTMRESARSRKTVLEFLRGEGSELLKSARASGLKQSTDTAPTYTHSFSGSSLLSQDDEDNKLELEVKMVETVKEGSEEDKSQEDIKDEAIHGTFQVPTKDKCTGSDVLRNDRLRLNASMSTSSTPGLNTDEDDGDKSIRSFSHEGETDQLMEGIDKDDSQDLASSFSSKILEFDFEDEELTNMFRRASLDHIPENLRRSSLMHRRSSSFIVPLLEDSELKTCFARSA
ncbi:hypothetical protein ACHAWO_004932 [Cyclotella atomus]|jgi:hypothetical protein|uniref:Uncharacterized protein n=1 Tax=Cyclotella atomus TaxID=382360 RepID=A0ABD3NVY0_9STRA